MAADHELDAVQQTLVGQFALERELGRGGMGIVYLARDVQLERRVAVKVLPPALRGNPEIRERFLREARTAGQLSHPHIVPVFRADEIGGLAFFVMALVEGESLGDRVRERGPLPPREAVRVLREVAWALAYAHARGVIHRDVKPENIMIERGSGRALVTDFGIARRDGNAALTADGQVMGSVHYMSPEQVAGEALDGRSDLYALGVVGFFILSGRLPFQHEAASAILLAHATREAPQLAHAAPGVPLAIGAVIDRCLSKDPAQRPATGEALADALEAAMDRVAQEALGDSGPESPISSARAAAIWQRAAQLQAAAAHRLEERYRESPADRTGPPEAATTGYRLRDVEAAAVEAGISQQFVALALAELPPEAPAPPPPGGWRDLVATRFLGATDPTLTVARVIPGSGADVLRALGQVLTDPPYQLLPADTVGGHPLDGGVIVFEVPPFRAVEATEQAGMTFRYYLSSARIGRLQVTLNPRAVAPASVEVRVFADLREDIRRDATVAVPAIGAGVLGGGVASWALGSAVLGLGALAVLPALAGGTLLGALTAVAYRGMHRHGHRVIQRALAEMLGKVEAKVRSRSLFGPLDPPPPLRPARGDDGSQIVILAS